MPGAVVKVWDGSAWNAKPAKRWNGSAWDTKPVKVWNGSTWIYTSGAVPTYVGESHANQSTAATSIATVLPAGVATGDLLVLMMETNDSSTNSVVTASTTGWTVLTALADQSAFQRALYCATYAPGLVMPSWSLTVAKKSAYQCVAVRNPARGATPSIGLSNAGGLTMTAPTVLAAPAGSIVLRLYARKDNTSTTITPPAGCTLIATQIGTGSSPSHTAAYYQVQPTLSSTGTAATTWDVTSVNSTAWTVST